MLCKFIFLGVPATQSACYGLRYRFGAERTMRASTHALHMPNASTQRVCTRANAWGIAAESPQQA